MDAKLVNEIINDNARGTRYKVLPGVVAENVRALEAHAPKILGDMTKEQIYRYGSGQDRLPRAEVTRIRAALFIDTSCKHLWPRHTLAVAAALGLGA